MPLVEVGLPALALVVAVRNPRVPELHTLLAKLSITYRWCAEHCPAPPHLSSWKVSGCSALSLAATWNPSTNWLSPPRPYSVTRDT